MPLIPGKLTLKPYTLYPIPGKLLETRKADSPAKAGQSTWSCYGIAALLQNF